jgi:hypothetical protein
VDWPFDRARDDPAIAVIARGVINDAVAQERPILHKTEHGIPPSAVLFSLRRRAGLWALCQFSRMT